MNWNQNWQVRVSIRRMLTIVNPWRRNEGTDSAACNREGSL